MTARVATSTVLDCTATLAHNLMAHHSTRQLERDLRTFGVGVQAILRTAGPAGVQYIDDAIATGGVPEMTARVPYGENGLSIRFRGGRNFRWLGLWMGYEGGLPHIYLFRRTRDNDWIRLWQGWSVGPGRFIFLSDRGMIPYSRSQFLGLLMTEIGRFNGPPA